MDDSRWMPEMGEELIISDHHKTVLNCLRAHEIEMRNVTCSGGGNI